MHQIDKLQNEHAHTPELYTARNDGDRRVYARAGQRRRYYTMIHPGDNVHIIYFLVSTRRDAWLQCSWREKKTEIITHERKNNKIKDRANRYCICIMYMCIMLCFINYTALPRIIHTHTHTYIIMQRIFCAPKYTRTHAYRVIADYTSFALNNRGMWRQRDRILYEM